MKSSKVETKVQENYIARPEMTDFSKRLREFIETAGLEKKALAAAGELRPSTITGYLKGTSQPSADVVGAWVLNFGVNANWLLTGMGPMFLEEAATAAEAAPGQGLVDPVAQRMETLVKLLKDNGADEPTIRRALVDLVRGPARYGSPLAEPAMPYEAVQEERAPYGDPDDTPPDTAAGGSE